MRRFVSCLTLALLLSCDIPNTDPDGPVPTPPTELTARWVSRTRVALTWNPNPDSWGYRVERAQSVDGAWTMVASVAAEVGEAADLNLDPDKSYYYVLRAFNGSGYSPPSNVAVASPAEPATDGGTPPPNDEGDADAGTPDAGTPDAGPAPNVLPTVALTAPAAGATAVAPGSFNLTANAGDADGTLTKVEFYRDGVLLSADDTAPYAFAWSNVAAGTYSLTARAYDNRGGITSSSAVSVTVTPPPPTFASFTVINTDNGQVIAELTPLMNGAVINSATYPNITLRANAQGAVGSVRFGLDNNNNFRTENTAPHDLNGDNMKAPLAAGAHTVTGTAFTAANGGGVAGATLTRTFTVQ